MGTSRCLILGSLLLAAAAFVSGQDFCYIPGECTRSLFVDEWPVDEDEGGLRGCLDLCEASRDNCTAVTYYTEDETCLGFAECEEVSPDTCDGCYVAETSCDDIQCHVPSSCIGDFLHSEEVNSEADCLELCQDDPECFWFTFFEEDSACVLLENCQEFDDEECDCFTGQRFCTEDDLEGSGSGGETTLQFVCVAGFNNNIDEKLDDVELVDLSEDGDGPTGCTLASYPEPTNDLGCVFVDGAVRCCGGVTEVDLGTRDCFEYDSSSDSWDSVKSMQAARYWFGSSLIAPDTWLISGDDSLASAEIWTPEGGFRYAENNMPSIRYRHCQTTLNDSYVLVAGGDFDSGSSVLLFDIDTEEWLEQEPGPAELSSLGIISCGQVENERGTEVLLIGSNGGNTLIYNAQEQSWRDGPAFPLADAIVVELGPQSLYVVGGREPGGLSDDRTTNTIASIDPDTFEFTLLPQTLRMARDLFAAVAVPEGYINCN